MSNSEQKQKRGDRLQRAWNAIKKQLKIAKAHGLRKPLAQPHRLAKHHAMDCGHSQCGVCSNPRKLRGEKTIQEKRAFQDKGDE